MTSQFYSTIFAIIAVNGCYDDTFLIPEIKIADNSHLLDNLFDGLYNTRWYGDTSGGEYVYFYYPSEVQVKWIFVQRYSNQATYFNVYDGASTIAYQYFGDSSESYDSVTIRFNDVYTDYLRFYFYYSATVDISRLEVHGCYNTSTPTTSPTTGKPTNGPTLFPTVSPTLAPLTAIPTDLPTTLPTSTPTVLPTMAEPSPDPSTVPSWSPTEVPSVGTVIPSQSPTLSPTILMPTNQPSVAPSPSPNLEPTIAVLSPFPSISPTTSPTQPPTVVLTANEGFQITLGAIECFLIAICCLCAVLLFVFLRYRKALLVNEALQNTADKTKHAEHKFYSAETGIQGGVKVVQTGNARHYAKDRVVQNNRTPNIVGEDSRQKVKDHHVDIRFALDKVSSNNGYSFNREGNLEIGPQESDL